MKRPLLLFLLSLMAAFPYAAAQNSVYLGVRLAGATVLEEDGESLPFLGVQLGVRVLEPIELRVAFDASVGVFYRQADLLCSQPLGDDRGYVGAGLDYYENGWNGEENYGVHGTVGFEYRTGSVRLFAEVQPMYGFDVAVFRIRSSLGINFPF